MRLREWMVRLIGSFVPRRSDSDMEEELRSHMSFAAESGRSTYGSIQALEAMRDQRGLPWLLGGLADIRYAYRALRKSWGFAATAILTLSTGIALSATIYSVVDIILIRPL